MRKSSVHIIKQRIVVGDKGQVIPELHAPLLDPAVLVTSSTMQISIQARGQGIDLPVYVEREMVDLRICMLDRLYQDSIVVHNRYNVHSNTSIQTTQS